MHLGGSWDDFVGESMTTLAEKFTAAADRAVAKFSVGTYTYKEITGETYDPDTGVVTRPEVTVSVPAARYNIADDKRAQMSYSERTSIVVMAGADLGAVVPQVGGLVIYPDGSRHRVVYVESDQYGAAHFLHVTRFPDGS